MENEVSGCSSSALEATWKRPMTTLYIDLHHIPFVETLFSPPSVFENFPLFAAKRQRRTAHCSRHICGCSSAALTPVF